jgi:hypothetical protein
MEAALFLRLAIATAHIEPVVDGVEAQALDALKNAHKQAVDYFGPDSPKTIDVLSYANHIFTKLQLTYKKKNAWTKAWKLDRKHLHVVLNGPFKTV